SFRRSGGGASRRVYRAEGPEEGYHHQRRGQHFHDRGGARPLPAPGYPGGGGGGRPRPVLGGGAQGLGPPPAGGPSPGRGGARIRPGAPGPFQMSKGGILRPAAEDINGQSAEV